MVNWYELDFFTSRWMADNQPPNSFDNFVYQYDKYSLNNYYNENEENYEYDFDELFEFNNSNDNYVNQYNDDHYSDYYQSSESEEDDSEYYNYN